MIYYTLDGSLPTTNSMIFNSMEPIFLDTIGLTTIRAFAHLDGFEDSELVEKTYNIVERCAKPVIIPNGGTFAGVTPVSLTSATPNSLIHFTVDGTTPTETSPISTDGTLLIDHTVTLKVITTRPGSAISQVTTADFIILPKVANPVITPAASVFAVSATLKVTCSTPNATIYYTVDGEDPNESSLRVDRHMPDIIIDTPGQHVLKTYATFPTMLASDLVTKSFSVLMRASSPSFVPPPGTFTSSVTITFQCAEDDEGVIFYTTDGITTPSTTSPHASCGESISLSGPGKFTIRSFRTSERKAPSAIVEGVYILLRPPYDTFPVNPNSTFQMKPDVDVFVVEKNLKPTGYSESRYCSDRNIRGRLVVLHNPVGHFDILEPLAGCGSGLVLPSVSGRDWKRNKAVEPLPSVRHFYRDKIHEMSSEEISRWQKEYSSNSGCDVVTNAGFFNITSTACFGDIVTNGKVVQTSELHNVNFGIRNGSFVIGYVETSEILGPQQHTNHNSSQKQGGDGEQESKEWIGFDTLVSGLVWLVRDSEVFVTESLRPQYGVGEDMTPQTAGQQFATLLSARTAIGFDAKGRLLILQVEGETWVRGMSLYEFATFAKELGFVSAINLDGGGSATMTVNQTLVSEPSWKCSRVRALAEYHRLQLAQSSSRRGQDSDRLKELSKRWNFHEERLLEDDLIGDGFRYCEKPVSSITCAHAMPPPQLSETWPSSSPTPQPSAPPTRSPTSSPSEADQSSQNPEATASPTLFPTTLAPTPIPSPLNVTSLLSAADGNLLSSLNFYRSASLALLISLLLSMLFNLLACCCCLMRDQHDEKSEQISGPTGIPSVIEMSRSQSSPAHGDEQQPSDPAPPSSSSSLSHSTPLSVPTSNSWQSKFKSLNLAEEDSEEDLHRIKVNRSPVREENDEEDASESEQFFKSPPSRSKPPEKSTGGGFFGSLKSSKSKSKSSSAQPSAPANWREELEEEDKAKTRFSFQAEDDGEHNPTAGGWLRRKKKSSKKKEGRETKESASQGQTIRRDLDGDGDEEGDIERG
jgi:hypothetical protein